MNDTTAPATQPPTTICVMCGADALVWADDLSSVKCDECGAFSEDED